jgi:hypothetical protein
MVEARAAFGFRKRHTRKTQLRGFLEKFAGEMAGLVEFFRQRTDF